MFCVSDQQASELLRRCKAIRDAVDPIVFSQIEALVQQAAIFGKLTDTEVNQLYDLLNHAIAPDSSDQEPNRDAEREYKKPATKVKDESGESDEQRDRCNHMLLCNSVNLRTVETMRRSIKSITSPDKRNRTREIRR